jgi:hypothetical protein
MKIIPQEEIVHFQVKFYDRELLNAPSDVIEVIYNNYEYAFRGYVNDFGQMVYKILQEIAENKEAAQ